MAYGIQSRVKPGLVQTVSQHRNNKKDGGKYSLQEYPIQSDTFYDVHNNKFQWCVAFRVIIMIIAEVKFRFEAVCNIITSSYDNLPEKTHMLDLASNENALKILLWIQTSIEFSWTAETVTKKLIVYWILGLKKNPIPGICMAKITIHLWWLL